MAEGAEAAKGVSICQIMPESQVVGSSRRANCPAQYLRRDFFQSWETLNPQFNFVLTSVNVASLNVLYNTVTTSNLLNICKDSL